jgi:hypothetical protein
MVRLGKCSGNNAATLYFAVFLVISYNAKFVLFPQEKQD